MMTVHQQIAHPSTPPHPLPSPPYHTTLVRPLTHVYPALPLLSSSPLSTAHVAKNDKGRICDANLRHADGRYFAMQVRRSEEKDARCTARCTAVVMYGVVYYAAHYGVY